MLQFDILNGLTFLNFYKNVMEYLLMEYDLLFQFYAKNILRTLELRASFYFLKQQWAIFLFDKLLWILRS